MVLVAMGIVFERYKGLGNVQMHRFNVQTGMFYDCDSDGDLPNVEQPKLTVEQNVMLYGGCVVPYDGKKGTYDWIFDDDFESDIKNMWEICKVNPGLWNAQIGTFSFLSENEKLIVNDLSVFGNKSCIEERMKSQKAKFTWVYGIVRSFLKKGLITDLIDSDDEISFNL